MTKKKSLQPKETSETETMSVPKELCDLMRPLSADFMPDITFIVHDFLRIVPMSELLNENGVNAVEQCLEHVANACLLPIEIDGEASEGFTSFKLRNKSKEKS